MNPELIDGLIVKNETKIVFLVMDGLGGLPDAKTGLTELEAARTPNLDDLAKRSTCGLLDPIGYGITPGSGPAHLALFGYDPIKNNVGRGLLEAAGINFPMTENDLLIRINFATMDERGRIIDRRAGRIDTGTNQKICKKLQKYIHLNANVKIFVEPVKEHRALLVIRGKNLRDELEETDPQKPGHKPLPPKALIPEAKATEEILTSFLEKAQDVLSDEKKANMLLLRGYAKYRRFPSMEERFGLNALAIAGYPMYRGIARLLGMAVDESTATLEDEIRTLQQQYANFDFFFLHVKPTDSRGEDGNFTGKVKVIEQVDAVISRILELKPDVLVVTGDHSTPAAMASHSWHPVPVVLSAHTCRPDTVEHFGERYCIYGGLGRIPMVHLMGLALAHAGRLEKFGA
jgi:2,3-bisphosphoglycerate-independent phosphoglycerate mutase